MTETVKKAKPAAKPRKTTTTKKKTAPASADPIAQNHHEVSENHSTSTRQPQVSHDEVARLAHRYWKERGHRHGHHEEDWYRAERELRGMAS
ncbi:DUF2934 domain-containing protein [Acidobacteria bacterium AB60]|nr:DUF2934 domain-containing protein [Acidobacteria bacterium AB60]